MVAYGCAGGYGKKEDPPPDFHSGTRTARIAHTLKHTPSFFFLPRKFLLYVGRKTLEYTFLALVVSNHYFVLLLPRLEPHGFEGEAKFHFS